MEIKDFIYTIIIALVVSLGVGFYFNQPNDNLGGQLFVQQPNFRYGYKIAGTEAMDSSRNISAGTISGSTGTFTGAISGTTGTFTGEITGTGLDLDFAATSTVQMGATTTPACLVMGDSDGAGISFVTVLNGEMTVTSTMPSTCTWVD